MRSKENNTKSKMASSAIYSPSRQARVAKLNTIIEDDAESRGRLRSTHAAVSPIPDSASTVSSYYESVRHTRDFDYNDLYDSPQDLQKTVRPKLQENFAQPRSRGPSVIDRRTIRKTSCNKTVSTRRIETRASTNSR